jgi:hypothetical protein
MIVNIAPGALVRDPVTKLPLERGADVDPNDPYIARALADGDLVFGARHPARVSRRKDQAHTSSNEDQA